MPLQWNNSTGDVLGRITFLWRIIVVESTTKTYYYLWGQELIQHWGVDSISSHVMAKASTSGDSRLLWRIGFVETDSSLWSLLLKTRGEQRGRWKCFPGALVYHTHLAKSSKLSGQAHQAAMAAAWIQPCNKDNSQNAGNINGNII